MSDLSKIPISQEEMDLLKILIPDDAYLYLDEDSEQVKMLKEMMGVKDDK